MILTEETGRALLREIEKTNGYLAAILQAAASLHPAPVSDQPVMPSCSVCGAGNGRHFYGCRYATSHETVSGRTRATGLLRGMLDDA